MRCPSLKDLPSPSPGKTGWPWTEESSQLSGVMSDGTPWPQISIITPSYNQGIFIEETIRSVLLQGYPDLEYIVIDGGSTDNSVEIIRKYERYLACWVSKADRGQADAINKGFAMASGKILAWINSDDIYTKNAFDIIAQRMYINGKVIRPVVYGDCDVIDRDGKFQKRWFAKPITTEKLITFWRKNYFIPQPTVFMADYTLRNISLNVSLRYVMDWELYLRLSGNYPFSHIRKCLARFRIYNGTKSSGGERMFKWEQFIISKGYWKPGIQTMQYRLEYCLAPMIGTLKRIPFFTRRFLKKLLKDATYYKLRQIKRRLIPRYGCQIREEDRYI
jgi:glycosyltransferase involved in cell wall biosynthesis